MTRIVVAIPNRAQGMRLAFSALVFVLVLSPTHAAAVQAPTWTENDAYQAWTGYHDYFYTSGAKGGAIFANQKLGEQTPDRWSTFWIEAEEIEVAEDAFYWAKKNGGTPSKYAAYVSDLAYGFQLNMSPTSNYGPENTETHWDWSGDEFNDDLMWASIAMARAYQITCDSASGLACNPIFLTAAKNQFNTVWDRAQAETNDPTGGPNGTIVGLLQSQPHSLPDGATWEPNLDSAVNWTFVEAGYLISDNGGGAQYKVEADAVFAWALANLYNPTGTCTGNSGYTCSQIYDANNEGPFNGSNGKYSSYKGKSISALDYTFNYGTALQALIREGNTTNQTYDTDARYVANHLVFDLKNSFQPYAKPKYGYNVLPIYELNNSDYDGFNGIALRGVGLGLARNGPDGLPILGPVALAFAQANLQAAWDIKNPDNVMWNDWVDDTGSTSNPNLTKPPYIFHSWDCSSAVAGMLDIPAPGGNGN